MAGLSRLGRLGPRHVLVLLMACSVFPRPAVADHPGGSFGTSTAGPIRTLTATPLGSGMKAVGLEMSYLRSNAFSDAQLERLADEHVHTHSTDALAQARLGFAYGITDRFTMGVDLPYIRRNNIREASHHHAEGGGAVNRAVERGDAGGIGDANLLGTYQVVTSLEGDLSASMLFGARIPTGRTDVMGKEGELLEIGQQPGSGSWDPMLGAALSWQLDGVSVDANVLYRRATEGDRETDLGDHLLYNLALSWRLGGGTDGAEHDHHSHEHEGAGIDWDFVLELNGERQWEETIGGVEQADTAGNVVFLSPGIRATLPSEWSGYLSAGIPVHEDVERAHPEPDFRVIAGIGRAF